MPHVARNWVFLGDSLTEGVGSKRISYVTELVTRIRSNCREVNANELRLRQVNSQEFNRDVEFNVAGKMDVDGKGRESDLWLWNLACEGQTIDSDIEWLPLIAALRPELVVIFRGSLESIIRPAMLRDGAWPWWVPQSWRGYAAMDPRCYFSTTSWRKAKQTTLDAAKQKVRLRLLERNGCTPLMDLELLSSHLNTLLQRLRALNTRVLVLGLLGVDSARFPGSPEYFKSVNERLEEIAIAGGAEFFDWALALESKAARDTLFYRDSFHPNLAGASALAEILCSRLCTA
jgi:lysophospholipase L1-like esterase